MAGEDSGTITLQDVPHVGVEVVVASDQYTTTLGERYRGYSTVDHVTGVTQQFLQSTKKPETHDMYHFALLILNFIKWICTQTHKV